MKRVITLSTLFILVAFTFNSCSKFEEGPGISLKSKKARLTNTWTIETITDKQTGDEISIMELLGGGESDSSGLGFEIELKFDFVKDGTMEMIAGVNIMGFSYEVKSPGTWEFVGDTGLELIIDSSELGDINGESTNDSTEPETMEYNILRLASNELWLEYTEEVDGADVEYEIHLIPAE
ncbi:MAG TPA: hypothetical protein DDX39_06650 [Bacteroidales bacterium]|nr:MAG: hypothetical protein A2W98_11310 [Bacteroidetes bacterium GWF2_33_38]OFY76674.1 MAG: hypothetical protein A2265_08945 [Bacteroidetes bacterium RIFOXYA12_FULL_33_9]OFY86767.1 MAG: hypothetical protein A2236_10450 [Bacteroidetes bacterium RIFOXYA2_FULL_33_7]HBF88306.1 hypothetical protein [Bacteroidales bacterium]